MDDLSNPSLFREQAFLGGRWSNADSGSTLDVTDPATGDLLGTVPDMGAAETEQAIDAAIAAAPLWAAMLAEERAAILRRWADLMRTNTNDLAKLMTREQGKPVAESKGEIAYAASFLDWFAGEGPRAYGRTIPTHDAAKRIVTIRQPVGIVGAITPWNFPAAMITRKAGPAFAAGCPMIVKPAAATPYTALALAVLAEEAGVQKGVFSVLTGSAKAIGGALTNNAAVRKITFTGSTEVGRTLLAQAADQVKQVSMELGGNAPFIVFDDADLDAAVEGAIASKFRNTGQTCVCTNRFYVQRAVYDVFAEKLCAAVGKLKVGNGLDEGVEQGPLIDEASLEKLEAHIADATAKGGKVGVGGQRHALGGTFYEPTVVLHASQDMAFVREETFGPLAALIPFDTEEEAVTLANDTEFGLAAYFYARDVGRVWRMGEAIESGMIGVNTGILSTAIAPFGGIKQSGLGREGGPDGIDEYLETKYLCMGL